MKKHQSTFTVLAFALAASTATLARADLGETQSVPLEAISDNTSKELPPPPPSSDYTGTRDGTTTPAPVELPTFQPPSHGEMNHVPPQAIDGDSGMKYVPYE